MTHYPTPEQRYFEEYHPTSPLELYGVELEREEHLEIIRDEARFGRPHSAWNFARQFIVAHFEDRPENAVRYARLTYNADCGMSEERWEKARRWLVRKQLDAFEDWLDHLRDLLAARREIYALTAKAERRMTTSERDRAEAWKRFLGEAA